MCPAEISVVLPVHQGVAPQHFRRTIESLVAQRAPASEVVIVEDGPLPQPLREAVVAAHDVLPVRLVSLPINKGAGIANQAGLAVATGEWIAKADADDVNLPERFERQLSAVIEHRLDLCGAAMLEFVGEESDVRTLRSAPLAHEAIGRRLRVNNPINHPTAFYRRTLALEAGGYPDWRYMQDYGLFARMYVRGGQMMNLDQPLVLFRAGDGVTSRRRSREIRVLEVSLQRELRALGIVGGPRMVANVAWRSAFRLLPARLVDLVGARVLARRVGDAHSNHP